MKEKDIAKAYAKSFIQLGDELNVDIAQEFTVLTEIINSSNDLENVMFLDLFTVEERKAVLEGILDKLEASKLTKNIISFLCEEKRLNVFPLIFKEIIVIDDHKKGFMRGTIEGATADIDEASKAKLLNFIETKIGKKAQLDYVQSDAVTAGFRVTVDDLQLDATVDNQLEKFKESIVRLH